MDYYNTLTTYLVRHLSTISFGIIAAILVLYGDPILKIQKKLLKPFHFLLRLIGFVLLAGIGFSLLAFWSESALTRALLSIPRNFLAPSLLGIFFILGTIAERKRFM